MILSRTTTNSNRRTNWGAASRTGEAGDLLPTTSPVRTNSLERGGPNGSSAIYAGDAFKGTPAGSPASSPTLENNQSCTSVSKTRPASSSKPPKSKFARRLTDAERKQIREMHSINVSLDKIAKALGCGITTVKRVLDAGYAERQRAVKRKGYVGGYENHGGLTQATRRSVVEDAQKLVEQIPEDTRDITGFLMGDPLPGRSALDRLRGQA